MTVIEKLFSKKFADSGSPAFDVLKKMTLTNDDQEAVAKAIAGDKVDPEQAGARLGRAEPATRSTAWTRLSPATVPAGPRPRPAAGPAARGRRDATRQNPCA